MLTGVDTSSAFSSSSSSFGSFTRPRLPPRFAGCFLGAEVLLAAAALVAARVVLGLLLDAFAAALLVATLW